ncbi:MAG: tyrosine-type recombinase/integrase [SAR324 cluster bacterium]|nr:tyrosine-type recombinase/integrase [SAR324 cluster bacterium]
MKKELHKPQVDAFSEKEIQKICDAIKQKDEWYYYFFMFALETGMRRNEILALTWHDVDLWKKREITVPDPKQPRIRSPRFKKIPIDESLLGLVLNLTSPSRWVFQKTGKRMLGGTVTLFFKELSRELRIQINSRRMRKTYVTRLFKKINPSCREDWKKLQKIMGHKDISTTKSYFQRNMKYKIPHH